MIQEENNHNVESQLPQIPNTLEELFKDLDQQEVNNNTTNNHPLLLYEQQDKLETTQVLESQKQQRIQRDQVQPTQYDNYMKERKSNTVKAEMDLKRKLQLALEKENAERKIKKAQQEQRSEIDVANQNLNLIKLQNFSQSLLDQDFNKAGGQGDNIGANAINNASVDVQPIHDFMDDKDLQQQKKSAGNEKNKTLKMVPCTPKELQQYLQSSQSMNHNEFQEINAPSFTIQKITGKRKDPLGNSEYKVIWEGFEAESEATWEPAKQLEGSMSLVRAFENMQLIGRKGDKEAFEDEADNYKISKKVHLEKNALIKDKQQQKYADVKIESSTPSAMINADNSIKKESGMPTKGKSNFLTKNNEQLNRIREDLQKQKQIQLSLFDQGLRSEETDQLRANRHQTGAIGATLKGHWHQGDLADKVLQVKVLQTGEILCLVSWQRRDNNMTPEPTLLSTKVIKHCDINFLLDFYEKRLYFNKIQAERLTLKDINDMRNDQNQNSKTTKKEVVITNL